MGGRNEQVNMISRNNGNDRSLQAVNVKRINAQVTTGGYGIEEPEPRNISVNEIDTNADTCCLGLNFTVLKMTPRTADVYPYDTSCKPFYNVPIMSGATTVKYSITGNSFIMVINEALYYSKKLYHSLINLNQLKCYKTMVWDDPFDPYRELFIETGDFNTIDLTPDGTDIGFISHVPMDEELKTLPHIEVTSGSERNPNTVKLGKVSMDKNDDAFELQLHLFGYHTI